MALNNENNNECCKCTIPEYEIILGAQGPQGRQGEKGEPGFTPIISIQEDTDNVYKLNILTQDGQITTPNLKAHLPDGGSTGMVLTKNSDANGDASFSPLPNASTENPGIVQLATVDDFIPNEEGNVNNLNVVTPDVLNAELKTQVNTFIVAGDNITTSVGDDGKVTINAEAEAYSLPQANATTLGGIKANPKTDEDTQPVNIDTTTGLLYTKVGGGELPDNITTQGNTFNGASQLVQLDNTGKLPAIDGSQLTNLPASPAPANMVTTDTSQTITGPKTLENSMVTLSSTTAGTKQFVRLSVPSSSEGFTVTSLISTYTDVDTYKTKIDIGSRSMDLDIQSDNFTANGAGVVTSDTNTNLKIWTGTQQEYDGIQTKDANTIYAIKEV